MKNTFSLLSAALLAAPVTTLSVDYQTEILPIFKSQCSKCHSGEDAKGDFSLDEGEIEKHIKSSGPIRPGKAERSELYELLVTEDEDERMPKEKEALPAEQITLIKQWIDEGASLGKAGDEEKDKEKGAADSPEKDGADSEEKMSDAADGKPEPITGTWTNAEGKTIQATLTGIEGDNVIFRLSSGQSVPYALSKLSPESQEKAKAFAEALKASEN